jgi:cobalt/nickel transport system permease protein
MHTPDGFLTSWVCYALLTLIVLPLLLALNNLRKNFTPAIGNKIATVAAVIFIAQMLNFPIASGTSGHLIGAAFAVLVLGTEGAVIALATVLLVQAIVFGDGGMLVLGANIFNMGIVAVYAAAFAVKRFRSNNQFIKTMVVSWISVLAASISCTILLAVSGTVALIPALIAMVSVHAIIGIGEGLLTYVLAATTDWKNFLPKKSIAIIGIGFLALAVLLPLASADPDGLEAVSLRLGFFNKAMTLYSAPVEYTLVGGIGGSLAVFVVTYSILHLIKILGDNYGQKTQNLQEIKADEETKKD